MGVGRAVSDALNRLDSSHRTHDLRAVCNATRWLVRTGAPWGMMPHDLPPWPAVFQQMPRWMRAGGVGQSVQIGILSTGVGAPNAARRLIALLNRYSRVEKTE